MKQSKVILADFENTPVDVLTGESFGDFSAYCQANLMDSVYAKASGDFYGADSATSASRIIAGDFAAVSRSSAMLSKLEDSISFESHRAKRVMSVAGYKPNVPAYLAGNPRSMWKRQQVKTESAPLTVLFDLSVSANVGSDIIERRGAAVMALVRALSATRPVKLVLCSGINVRLNDNDKSRDVVLALVQETNPMDLVRLSWAMQSAEFYRRFCFAASIKLAGHNKTGSLRWLTNRGSQHSKALMSVLRQSTMSDECILIEGLNSESSEIPFASDEAVLNWVTSHIAKLAKDSIEQESD